MKALLLFVGSILFTLALFGCIGRIVTGLWVWPWTDRRRR